MTMFNFNINLNILGIRLQMFAEVKHFKHWQLYVLCLI